MAKDDLFKDKNSELFKRKAQEADLEKMKTLDTFYRLTQPLGSFNRAIGNNLYGINHRNLKGVIPENRDSQGLVFFTRPLLNLSSGNIARNRKLQDLLTTNQNSMHRFVRCTLDPRTRLSKVERAAMFGFNPDGELSEWKNFKQTPIKVDTSSIIKAVEEVAAKFPKVVYEGLTSPLVDENNVFIPVLTNLLKSMSGWPDSTMATFTSKEGLKREQWAIADGALDIFDSFDLDCNFRNIKDEPLILLFETWLRYMEGVFEGMMEPYPDVVIENEIDYTTRIYRLVLDESFNFVKKIAATGASFPLNVPNGKFFDYDDSSKYNTSTREINIRFKCVGAMYNDPILIHEFNQHVAMFNPRMKKLVNEGYNPNNSPVAEIPWQLLDRFNNRGYPLIDKETLQLKWFINKDSKTYQEVLKFLKKETV